MSTRQEITNRYRAAEQAGMAALRSAQDLNFAIGQRDATPEQHEQLVARLCEAWQQGHLAERSRGDYFTMFHAEDPNATDEGHKDAVVWINDNIMTPTANLAQLRGINLRGLEE